MACHSVGEGEEAEGGTFAANLSRVGEKANYDYLVRWVHNPRERTRPYCPLEKRDLGPEDYERHGLPFVFDLDHSTCPNDGAELQVQQMTVMPKILDMLNQKGAKDVIVVAGGVMPDEDVTALKEMGVHGVMLQDTAPRAIVEIIETLVERRGAR